MAFLPPSSLTPASSNPPAISTRPTISATTANPAQVPTRPARVIPSPLPSVLIYDHCPFCVRVRHVLGLKNVKHELIWLANDDSNTPTSLVGRKVVPIFQPQGRLSTEAMPESLEICEKIDSDPRYGPTGLFLPQTSRDDISKWTDSTAMSLRRLTRTRFAVTPLPEFSFEDGRNAYIKNHPLSDPDTYEENFERSPEYIKEVQDRLDELADMIECAYHCSPEGLSFDDVILFAKIRALTIIKGLILPKKIRDYLEYHSKAAEIPLYDCYAI